MKAVAVVLEKPEHLMLRELTLIEDSPEDLLIDVEWSGISSGTERLLWSGRMPPFPGMGYPLVPGYESVGRVRRAGAATGYSEGERVFVPGANCYDGARGLFGGSSSALVTSAKRAVRIPEALEEKGILIALAATAYHAVAGVGASLPELIVGHGIVGRLMARVTVALGGAPIVWETNPLRRDSAGYGVIAPEADTHSSYNTIADASGDAGLIDTLIRKLAKRGEIALAGFYEAPISFAFPPAFMREARLRIAAEWAPDDIAGVTGLIADGRLSLDGLITDRRPAAEAPDAYRKAFTDPSCLKMILDWRTRQ
jgi:3-hydroxyethyl bacteriochlorophyllide a dehydrogenase